MNLAALTGPDAFGRAYRIMLEYDAHWLHGEAHG